MKLSILLAATLVVSMAWSQQRPVRPSSVEIEIQDLTREINQTVRSGQLTRSELEDLRGQLRDVVDSLYGAPSSPSKVICTKQSNGLFYPTSAASGSIIGSTSSNAGYGALDDCRGTLPAIGESLSCFKQSNGLHYPSNPETGSIVGSTSSNAGYGSLGDCRLSLPKRRATVACFKQSNGLYYPANPQTGSIIGSTSSNAGYGDLASCLAVVNQ